ncbi:MAG: hypothetical protein ACR2MG_20815 [Pyrinomonadaceae bacterium]
MIQSFKHRGLRELFEKGKSKHIASDFAPRLLRQMDTIDEADALEQEFVRYVNFLSKIKTKGDKKL